MKQLGKESIRQMELMRFYLQWKQDPHGPNLALFVGNLPQCLTQRNYENLLTNFLGAGKSLMTFTMFTCSLLDRSKSSSLLEGAVYMSLGGGMMGVLL